MSKLLTVLTMLLFLSQLSSSARSNRLLSDDLRNFIAQIRDVADKYPLTMDIYLDITLSNQEKRKTNFEVFTKYVMN